MRRCRRGLKANFVLILFTKWWGSRQLKDDSNRDIDFGPEVKTNFSRKYSVYFVVKALQQYVVKFSQKLLNNSCHSLLNLIYIPNK